MSSAKTLARVGVAVLLSFLTMQRGTAQAQEDSASRLAWADVKIILAHTEDKLTVAETRALIFGLVDNDGDGVLSQIELDRIREILLTADTNIDQRVTAAELDAWLAKRRESQPVSFEKLLDSNHDGKSTSEDLSEVGNVASRILTALDADRNAELSSSELSGARDPLTGEPPFGDDRVTADKDILVSWLLDLRERLLQREKSGDSGKVAATKKLFRVLDRDNDGLLTSRELPDDVIGGIAVELMAAFETDGNPRVLAAAELTDVVDPITGNAMFANADGASVLADKDFMVDWLLDFRERLIKVEASGGKVGPASK